MKDRDKDDGAAIIAVLAVFVMVVSSWWLTFTIYESHGAFLAALWAGFSTLLIAGVRAISGAK